MSKELVRSDGPDPGKGQFLVYEAEDGRIKIDVRFENENVWLTQKLMADLFQVTVATINEHIKNIYNERELIPDATIRKFRIVQKEGRRNVTRMVDHHNLDMIISVGYRVKSHERVDSDKTNMGLTSWRGAKVRKQDVTIAKNYLIKEELLALNNLVEQYLIFAEGQAMRRLPMHMTDWIKKLDAFLSVNEREILTHAGKISHEMAKEMAETEYEKFNRRRIRQKDRLDSDFDKTVKQLTDGKRGKKK
ncbi:MAG: virulence RhuM family protein [Deltaproteobacteria bacterium]|nr:virulence RhuM family protein [Deltaproteobacteria bacterium]